MPKEDPMIHSTVRLDFDLEKRRKRWQFSVPWPSEAGLSPAASAAAYIRTHWKSA